MEEVFIEQQERHDAAQSMEPVEILRELMRGNTRFWTGVATRPELSAMERRALIVQQAPKVVIVGCSDSRVPIEIVFDQGLGDVFAIRVAGNTIQRMTKRTAAVAAFTPWVDPVRASIDYAVHKLGCRLILVLGHEGCGAIKAATATKANKTPKSPRTTSSPFLDDDDDLEGEPPALVALLSTLGDELHKAAPHLDGITDRRSREREAVVTNARLQVERILEDPRLRLKEENDDLLVVASFYEISTGVVEFLDLPERVRIPH